MSKPTWVAQHDELPSHVVLGHGDPESRWAKVGVLLRESNHPGASVDVVDTLAGMHGAEEGLHLTLEQTHGMKWADVDLAVEGVPRRFRMIGDEQHWLAYREDEETWLFVHARGIPPRSIDLVRVDPRDYLTDG